MKKTNNVNRREIFKTMGAFSLAPLFAQAGSSATFLAKKADRERVATEKPAQSSLLEVFSLDGNANILEEKQFGVINGRITTGINYRDVMSVSGQGIFKIRNLSWAKEGARSQGGKGTRSFRQFYSSGSQPRQITSEWSGGNSACFVGLGTSGKHCLPTGPRPDVRSLEGAVCRRLRG